MRKTILITGSTDGIGKLTAIKMAKDGHHVYLHGRNAAKLANSITEVKKVSNNEHVKGFIADFSDLNAVHDMANKILSEVPKLDVLVNNAGIFGSPINTTKHNIDIRLVVNYFAPYVLTNSILPLFKSSSDARIVNLSSAAQSTVSIDALTGMAIESVNDAYAQSKLALTMWSFYLAKRLDSISVLAVNPGSLLNTKMANEAYGQYWSSADKGRDILCDLAISNDYVNVTGKYFDNDKGNPKGAFGPAHADAYDKTKIETLIKVTENVLNKTK
ncbi:MAG: short-chain dehydrogenase [Bacteroidetes bacterium MedPE-SWsnd-G1]|nr:MAG: short-chain dehydrogenase [Bacteroidetes bacterium MedPE-SWsnd-G1]